MASVVGGTVTWVLDVETGKFTSGLASAKLAVKSATDDIGGSTKKVNSHFKETAASVSQSLGTIASALGRATIATGLAIGTSSYGIMGMAKASWDQVVAVENATFALKAYEKDAGKVSNVLSELVKYAQSDMGVLFQRQDLFDAASTMKLYGIETSKLVDYTKILSKGVAVGKTSFQELSDIMGRVASSGQLTGDAFDMLVMRGIKLPDTMRNAKVSAEELFQALDKSLPDELLVGRANTISGIMTRLQSAFRNLGSQILGVDKETSQFIKGGLGDTIVTTMVKLRDIMASPAMKESFANLGKSIGNFVKNALPLLIKGFMWMANNLPTVIALFGVLAATWIAVSIAATIASIAALPLTWPMYAIAAAVIILVGVLAWLQMKFGVITKAVEFLKPIFEFVVGIFKELWKSVKDLATVLGKELAPVFAFVAKHAEIIKKILMVTTLIGFAPLLFVIGSAIAALKLLAIVIGFVSQHFQGIKKILMITTIIGFAPLILIIGITIFTIKALVWAFNFLVSVFETVILAFMRAIQWVKDLYTAYEQAFNNIVNTVATLLIRLSQVILDIWNNIQTIIAIALAVITNTISGAWNNIYNILVGIVNGIIRFFAGAWSWLVGAGQGIVGGLARGISSMAGALWGAIASVSSHIGRFFAGAGGWLYGAGRNIIQGLANGISNMAGAVQQKASEIANSVKNTIQNALKIKSPSRVMIGFGENISQGLAIGIEDGINRVKSISSDLSTSVTAPMVDTSSIGTTNNTSNQTISINGPITLGDQSAVDRFFDALNRNGELARKGLATI